jgi:hypothetical protein
MRRGVGEGAQEFLLRARIWIRERHHPSPGRSAGDRARMVAGHHAGTHDRNPQTGRSRVDRCRRRHAALMESR